MVHVSETDRTEYGVLLPPLRSATGASRVVMQQHSSLVQCRGKTVMRNKKNNLKTHLKLTVCRLHERAKRKTRQSSFFLQILVHYIILRHRYITPCDIQSVKRYDSLNIVYQYIQSSIFHNHWNYLASNCQQVVRIFCSMSLHCMRICTFLFLFQM